MPVLQSPLTPTVAPGPAGVVHLLRQVAAEARRLWQDAVDAGDFAEMTRWLDTSQAVHRALVAAEARRRR